MEGKKSTLRCTENTVHDLLFQLGSLQFTAAGKSSLWAQRKSYSLRHLGHLNIREVLF